MKPTDEQLAEARKVGDPLLKNLPTAGAMVYLQFLKESGLAEISKPGANGGPSPAWRKAAAKSDFFKRGFARLEANAEPRSQDLSALERAGVLFGEYGHEISCALILAALPETYAAEKGSKILVDSKALVTDVGRRIRGTAQYLMLALTPLPDFPASDELRWRWSTRATWALRLQHEAIRRLVDFDGPGYEAEKADREVPINQEDLLGTLLTFTVTVFDVLERLGVYWTPEEQQTYLDAWNGIGRLLGVADRSTTRNWWPISPHHLPAAVRRPETVAEARATLQVIRERQWVSMESMSYAEVEESTRHGRLLTNALVRELQDAMPRACRGMPQMVIRELVPDIVGQRIGIRSSGLVEFAMDSADSMMMSMSRSMSMFTGVGGMRRMGMGGGPGMMQDRNRLRTAHLHASAVFVTQAAIVHFIRTMDRRNEPRFVMPGLDDWVDALREPGR